MNKALFSDLVRSLKEASAILAGKSQHRVAQRS